MTRQVKNMDLGSELLKTRFFNRSETRTFQSAGVFGLPVEKAKEFLRAVVGIKKRANYLFRMFTPSIGVLTNVIKKKKNTCFGVSPPLEGVLKKHEKVGKLFHRIKNMYDLTFHLEKTVKNKGVFFPFKTEKRPQNNP